MRIKFLSFIASFFMVSFVITSCLDDDNNIEYSPDATIHAFELDTIGYGKTYKFTIDQLKGEIYNEDSLPVHADTIIDRILIKTLTTASQYVTILKEKPNGDGMYEDSVYLNLSDSIDLRKPLKLRVYSTEALAYGDREKAKKYTISVRVHKHDPDSLRWSYVGKVDDNINGPQRSIVLGANIITYTDLNGIKVYQSAVNNPNNWTSTSISTTDGTISTMPTSIISFNNKLYATFKDNENAYTSTDGITWSKSKLENVKYFLAPINGDKDKISYIRKATDEGKYFFATSTDGETEDYVLYEKYKNHLSADAIKRFPNNITSYINYENRNGTKGAMLIGEAEQSTTLSDDKDDKMALPWGYSEDNISVNKLNEQGEEILDDNGDNIKETITISRWVDLPAGSSLSYCPELINPTLVYYNSQFYLFGNGFDSFYTSPSGRDWKKTDKKFSFPNLDEDEQYSTETPEFRGRENYSMVMDKDNQYLIFIFSKGSVEEPAYQYNSEVWRARLNQLWFDLAKAGK